VMFSLVVSKILNDNLSEFREFITTFPLYVVELL
jgi:hypothetical protein